VALKSWLLVGAAICMTLVSQNMRVALQTADVKWHEPDHHHGGDGDTSDGMMNTHDDNLPNRLSSASRQQQEQPQQLHVPHGDFLPQIQIGARYSAKVCWLDPAWATNKTIANAPASNASSTATPQKKTFLGDNPCVGRHPNITTTPAMQLSCPPDNHPALSRTQRRSSSSTKLTIALLYYASPAPLLRQLQQTLQYPDEIRQHITLLIIDDGSPPGLTANEYIPASTNNIQIRIARITKDKAWNIGGARNLAFYLTQTRRVLLNDLDILIPTNTMQQVMTWPTVNATYNGIAHRFHRLQKDGTISKHPAVSLLDAGSYWNSGGCDEDLVGNYGFTDVHFWYRWKKDASRVMLDHDEEALVHEFDDTKGLCDEGLLGREMSQVCTGALVNMTKPKKTSKQNRRKVQEKMETGCWSNRYLRFPWTVER